jgi:hypothetical protein
MEQTKSRNILVEERIKFICSNQKPITLEEEEMKHMCIIN